MTITGASYNHPPRSRGTRLAIVIAALAALTACAQPPRTERAAVPQAAPQPAAQAEIDLNRRAPVALLVPLGAQGGPAAEARGIADAARMAVEELGAGLVALEVYDTGGTASGTASATRRALDGGAALILGPLFGANAAVAGAAAAARGVNVISFSTSTEVAGGNVWLISQLPSDEAQRIVAFAHSKGYSRLGVFRPDTPYGVAADTAVQAAARRSGAAVVAQGVYNYSFEGIQTAAQPYSVAHIAAGADAVVLPAEDIGLRTVASFLDNFGVSQRSGKYLGFSIWAKDPRVRKEYALQGGWFPSADPDRIEAFAKRYAARFGTAPTWLAPLGYDAAAAAIAMVRAARASGLSTAFDAAAITDPAGYSGATGALRFTPDGLNQRALAVLEVTSEGFLVVDPAPAAPGGTAGL
jgi:branched-chain amino acid transport system substrate-binding protein